MIYRSIGKTDIDASILSLGAAPLANLYREVPEAQAVETIRTALDRGVNLFDTAPRYGSGLSERRLGAALRGVPRDQYVLATKVGWLIQPEGERKPDFSRDGVLRSLEGSLERLQMGYVDILHIHDPDRHLRQAMDEAYPTLDSLRRQGVIKAVSAGMNHWEPLMDFVQCCDFDCFMLAGRYTLLEQGALPLLDVCAEQGIGILLAGVYNSGILATGAKPGAKYNYRDAPPDIMEKTVRLEEICKRYNVPLPAAALQFPLGHPAISTLVIGASSPGRIDSNLGHLKARIPPELWADMKAEGLVAEDCPVPQEAV